MTARKYGVDPNNIRRWKNNFAKDEATQAADGTNTLLRKTDIILVLRKKTRHKGKLGTMSEEIRKYLLDFYESLREQGHVITPTMMAIELCQKYPEKGANIPFHSIMLASYSKVLSINRSCYTLGHACRSEPHI